jgi:hypothetical protein
VRGVVMYGVMYCDVVCTIADVVRFGEVKGGWEGRICIGDVVWDGETL